MNNETTLVSKLENAFNVSFSLILKISLLTARYCSIHHGMLITTNKFYNIKKIQVQPKTIFDGVIAFLAEYQHFTAAQKKSQQSLLYQAFLYAALSCNVFSLLCSFLSCSLSRLIVFWDSDQFFCIFSFNISKQVFYLLTIKNKK